MNFPDIRALKVSTHCKKLADILSKVSVSIFAAKVPDVSSMLTASVLRRDSTGRVGMIIHYRSMTWKATRRRHTVVVLVLSSGS